MNYNGGLVGYSGGDTITNCYSTGSVTGERNVGGLVGYSSEVTITNCYSTSSVTGEKQVGGLVGYSSKVTITNCYSTGSVTGEELVGGLVGFFNNSTGSGNYYNEDACSVALGFGTSSGFTACAISQILASSNLSSMGFTTANGWSAINGQNPTLTNMGAALIPTYLTNLTTINALDLTNNTNNITSKKFITNSTTTSSITVTGTTTFATIGLSDAEYLIETTQGFLTLSSSSTFNDLITGLQEHNITVNLTNGILSLGSSSDSAYIKTIDSNLLSAFKLSAGNGYTYTSQIIQTETVKTEYTTTTTHTTETQTIVTTTTSSTTQTTTLVVTTTSSSTQTSTIWITSTVAATGGTSFEELGVSSAFNVTIVSDGTSSTLSISKDTTFDEFFAQLRSKGFAVSENIDEISLTGTGDTYLYSTFLKNLLSMSALNKTESVKTINTESDYLFYNEVLEDVYAPGTINLQVGTSAEPESKVQVNLSFKLSDISKYKNIGLDGANYLKQLDMLLNTLSSRQVEFGAMQNRLESVLDEIMIKRDNLVSSRSTLRDADIARESSRYIQQQILQQASATLLATANQSPSIALQLI